MLVSAIGMLMQLQFAGAPAVAREPTPDSASSLHAVQDAQRDFERSRRGLLPWEDNAGGRCDERVGRFCWWYDEGGADSVPEADAITQRRIGLLRQLDLHLLDHPGDAWATSLRVRYRAEAGHLAEAIAAAEACSASVWWCSALTGYAQHIAGRENAADSSFRSALVAMPPAMRCAWQDISTLLPADDRRRYRALDCADRHQWEGRYWMLSRIRLSTLGDEWRNEFLSRRVIAGISALSATPHALRWGDDAAELVLRYGWPMRWARARERSTALVAPTIIGHDPAPSFPLAPDAPFDSSLALPDDAWNLRSHSGPARYAPARTHSIGVVSAQLARFQRGDSTLVVAAYATNDDSLQNAQAWLTAFSTPAIFVTRGDSAHVGRLAVMSAGSPPLVGIELVDTTTRRLARSRRAFGREPAHAALMISDLLLYRARDEPPESVEQALETAIAGDAITVGERLGIFWETYGLAGDGEPVEVRVVLERLGSGWWRRARERLGLATAESPLQIQWPDARPSAGGVASRGVAVDLSALAPARYRVAVVISTRSGDVANAEREIEIHSR